MWHGFSNTGIHVLRISSGSAPILYLPVYRSPLIRFLCEHRQFVVDMHVTERKLNSLLPSSVLWQHITARLHILSLLFCFHLIVINEQYQSVPPPFLFDCHNWCAPHDISTIIRPDLLHWRPSLSCANCFLENVKPSPQSDNVRHSEYRELSIDSAHLTVTFSNLK